MSCPPFMNNTSDIVLTHELGKVLLIPNEDFALEWLMYVEFLSNTRLIDHGGNRMADLSVTRNVNKLFFCPTNICNPLLEVWAYLHKESRALRTWMACSGRMVMAEAEIARQTQGISSRRSLRRLMERASPAARQTSGVEEVDNDAVPRRCGTG